MAADPRLKRAGVSGYNKPKRTPNHPKKSHVVVAKEGNKVKTIRYGQPLPCWTQYLFQLLNQKL